MVKEFKDFNAVLDRLKDSQSPLTSEILSEISDMNRARREAFRLVWPQVDVARRQEIIRTLAETAETNIEFDFNAVMRLALEDEDAEVRAQAIAGLWEDEDHGLIGRLLNILRNDPSEQVRADAAESLGRYILLGELGDLEEFHAFSVQEALLQTFNTQQESVSVRCKALESLAYSSDEAISDLIEAAYNDRDERLAYSALFSMGRSADPRWQGIVIRELENSRPEFRYEAAQACGRLELVEAVHSLGEIAEDDSDLEVRAMAIWALGQIGDTEARRIINTLWDRQEEEGEESDLIRQALFEAQEELAFQQDALDMSFFRNDWMDSWDEEIEDDWDETDDEDDGSNGHGY